MSQKLSLESVYKRHMETRIEEIDKMRIAKAEALAHIHQKYGYLYSLKEAIESKIFQAIDEGSTEAILIDETENPNIALYDTDLKSLFQYGIPGKTDASLEETIRLAVTNEFLVVYRVEMNEETNIRRVLMILRWETD